MKLKAAEPLKRARRREGLLGSVLPLECHPELNSREQGFPLSLQAESWEVAVAGTSGAAQDLALRGFLLPMWGE